MMPEQRLINVLFLLALPLIVAGFGLSLFSALLLLLLALLWRQLIVLTTLMAPADEPDLVLETILNSHFAEKGRWCLDRLGVPYEERPAGGIIGVFFRGRTVPRLDLRTGRTRSSICESSHILRYLYGRFVAERPERAAFLAPTPERLAWEQRLDHYGAQLQVWIYHHLLKDPALCKHAWGAESGRLPAWQRWTILVMYPFFEMFIRRAFQPDQEHYENAVKRIEELLGETEELLADGRSALLGSEAPDFVDFTLASLSSLWAWPDNFAGGLYAADRPPMERLSLGMRSDMERWRERFPATAAHIDRLYDEERSGGANKPVSEPPAAR
jgi:glutathione S-transferase